MFGELALEVYDQEACRLLISILRTLVLESKVERGGFDEVLGRQGRPKLFWPLVRILSFEGTRLIERLSEMTFTEFVEDCRDSPSFFSHLGQQSLLLIFARLVQS